MGGTVHDSYTYTDKCFSPKNYFNANLLVRNVITPMVMEHKNPD